MKFVLTIIGVSLSILHLGQQSASSQSLNLFNKFSLPDSDKTSAKDLEAIFLIDTLQSYLNKAKALESPDWLVLCSEGHKIPLSYQDAYKIYQQYLKGKNSTLKKEDFQKICTEIHKKYGINTVIWFLDIYNTYALGGHHSGIQEWNQNAVPYRVIPIPIEFTSDSGKIKKAIIQIKIFGKHIIDSKNRDHSNLIPINDTIEVNKFFKQPTLMNDHNIVGTRLFAGEIEKFLSKVTNLDIPLVNDETPLAPFFGGNFPSYVETKYIFDPQLKLSLQFYTYHFGERPIINLIQDLISCETYDSFSDKLTETLRTNYITSLGLEIQKNLMTFALEMPDLQKIIQLERLPHLHWNELSRLLNNIFNEVTFTYEKKEILNKLYKKMLKEFDNRKKSLDILIEVLRLNTDQDKHKFIQKIEDRDHILAYHNNRRFFIIKDSHGNNFLIAPNDKVDLPLSLIALIPGKEGKPISNDSNIEQVFHMLNLHKNDKNFWIFQSSLTKGGSIPQIRHWHYISVYNKFGQAWTTAAEHANVIKKWNLRSFSIEKLDYPMKLYRIHIPISTFSSEKKKKVFAELNKKLKQWENNTASEIAWAFKIDAAQNMQLYLELRKNAETLKQDLGEERFALMPPMGMMLTLGDFGQILTNSDFEKYKKIKQFIHNHPTSHWTKVVTQLKPRFINTKLKKFEFFDVNNDNLNLIINLQSLFIYERFKYLTNVYSATNNAEKIFKNIFNISECS